VVESGASTALVLPAARQTARSTTLSRIRSEPGGFRGRRGPPRLTAESYQANSVSSDELNTLHIYTLHRHTGSGANRTFYRRWSSIRCQLHQTKKHTASFTNAARWGWNYVGGRLEHRISSVVIIGHLAIFRAAGFAGPAPSSARATTRSSKIPMSIADDTISSICASYDQRRETTRRTISSKNGRLSQWRKAPRRVRRRCCRSAIPLPRRSATLSKAGHNTLCGTALSVARAMWSALCGAPALWRSLIKRSERGIQILPSQIGLKSRHGVVAANGAIPIGSNEQHGPTGLPWHGWPLSPRSLRTRSTAAAATSGGTDFQTSAWPKTIWVSPPPYPTPPPPPATISSSLEVFSSHLRLGGVLEPAASREFSSGMDTAEISLDRAAFSEA